MRVILLDNIRGIGQVGDIKEVSDGYARNFLIPRGKARLATVSAEKEVAAIAVKKRESLALERQQAETLAGTLAGLCVELSGKANAQGTLFSALDPADIASAVSAKAGIHIASDQIEDASHLKSLGEHPVTIRLAEEVSATVTVAVSAQIK